MKYHFQHSDGTPSEVEAENEVEARHLAMVKRWGPPNGRPAHDIGPDGRYLSAGLSLVTPKHGG